MYKDFNVLERLKSCKSLKYFKTIHATKTHLNALKMKNKTL